MKLLIYLLLLLIILWSSKVISLSCLKMLIVAAASKFIELAIKESDNNIKLIVLDKLDKLHAENEGILEDLVMEVLVVLSR
jgi:coatomer subunit beta